MLTLMHWMDGISADWESQVKSACGLRSPFHSVTQRVSASFQVQCTSNCELDMFLHEALIVWWVMFVLCSMNSAYLTRAHADLPWPHHLLCMVRMIFTPQDWIHSIVSLPELPQRVDQRINVNEISLSEDAHLPSNKSGSVPQRSQHWQLSSRTLENRYKSGRSPSQLLEFLEIDRLLPDSRVGPRTKLHNVEFVRKDLAFVSLCVSLCAGSYQRGSLVSSNPRLWCELCAKGTAGSYQGLSRPRLR